MTDNSKKRKQATDTAQVSKRPRFPQPLAPSSPGTKTSTAYPNGEINVKNFLKSHENEIKLLENAMQAAKKRLSRRAFQLLPRELRRRTASHNPQRVPKRLRARARQEAKDDNVTIVKGKSGSGIGKGKRKWLKKEGIERSREAWERRQKRRKEKRDGAVTVEPMEGVEIDTTAAKDKANEAETPKKRRPKFPALATPETPPSRFRRRQRDKTWLPTHIWHTKRARMTPPKEPLWRFAIPLVPVVKAFRLTHRSAWTRGAVAWDTSYMATIGLQGIEASIIGLLKGLHFGEGDDQDPWQDRGKAKKWRNGTRAWEAWIHEREGSYPRKIALVTVIWGALEGKSKTRTAFIRVHPSAHLQLWNEVIRLSKVQKPCVTVEDLRFEVGSIEIIGPAAAETLCSILSPLPATDSTARSPQMIWRSLATVTDPGLLPPGALLAFSISDPRLRDPPTTAPMLQADLIEIVATWAADDTQTMPAIFSRSARLAASRSLPSEKSINRRRAANTLGGYPEPRPTDPQIPVLVYASSRSKCWTILLPWKCVMPAWREMMRYPVSTGGNPRFGGLKERRQVDFERSLPSFPFDYPGTDAGWDWELKERAARKHDWTKRPRGKRIEWSTINLGNGRKGEVGDPWACDWVRLLPKSNEDDTQNGKDREDVKTPFRQIPSERAADLIAGHSVTTDYFARPHVFTAKISMTQRGTPTTCARVYRLPSNNSELRRKWLSLASSPRSAAASKPTHKRLLPRATKEIPKYMRNRQLAQSLLSNPALEDDSLKASDADYPVVPDEEDLIGFVTTGNFNLAEGTPTAIANIALHKVLGLAASEGTAQGEGRVCIVREAGRTIGRLAMWQVV